MDERERYESGMQVRRAVLGEEHVERAEQSKSDLDTEFQDLITRYAWGEIWTRPGLARHTRSLLTIGLMVRSIAARNFAFTCERRRTTA